MMLNVLGLSPDAEIVYAAMLEQQQASLMDLVNITGLAEVQVRSALDEMAEHTFVRPSQQSPIGMRVVSPEVALNVILRRQEADLARRAQEVAASKAAAAEFVASVRNITPNQVIDGTERLPGIDAIKSKLEILAMEVEQECLSVMPGGGQSQASLEASQPLDADALGRGIDLLTLYQDSVRNDPATFAYAQWLTDHGGEVRTAPLLPPRMVIFDRKVAVIPIDPDHTREGALCTREPGIVATFVAMYLQAWSIAVPLAADQGRDAQSGLTAVERDLLILLAQGMTDDMAARRLGIGLRTVRRLMAGIMERLGATSRFEAGLKAAQRGWV